MEKTFVLSVSIIAIIGFFVSAYIFSQTDIITDITNNADNMTSKKLEIMNEINKCINENSVENGSIHFNSFEKNFISNIIIQVENIDDEEDLDRILEQFYNISTCKRD